MFQFYYSLTNLKIFEIIQGKYVHYMDIVPQQRKFKAWEN